MPCDGCPRQSLRDYMASAAGMQIQLVADLEFALHAGVAIRLSDIPYPDFLLLRQLSAERHKHDVEEIEKKSRKR